MAALCSRTAPDGALAQLLADRDRYFAFVSRRVANTAAAEDILQTAYLKVVERGVALRDGERLVGWFYTVLRNAAFDHMRKSMRSHKLRSRLAAEPERASEAVDDECASVAQSLITALDATHRDALDTVYIEGGSIAQLAEKAGITRNAATVRLHRARQALGELLDGCGCGSGRDPRTSGVMRESRERQQG